MTTTITTTDERPMETATSPTHPTAGPDRRASPAFAFAPDMAGHTGFGRSILVWLAVGAATVFSVVAGGMIAGGTSHADAIGVGIFAALWGGLGFGVMVGGVVHANRLEKLVPATVPVRVPAGPPER